MTFILHVSFWLHSFCGKLRGWDPVNRFNHTSWVSIATPTDGSKSVHNLCVIEVFGGIFCVVTLRFGIFSVGVGAFVIRLSQISSFFNEQCCCVCWVYLTCSVHCHSYLLGVNHRPLTCTNTRRRQKTSEIERISLGKLFISIILVPSDFPNRSNRSARSLVSTFICILETRGIIMKLKHLSTEFEYFTKKFLILDSFSFES